MSAFVYILRCNDGAYYVGSTRSTLETRLAEHNSGTFGGYTARKRPVALVWHQEFQFITDAIAAERQLKGWTRAKKEALMRGDFATLQSLALGKTNPRRQASLTPPHPSTSSG
jgi:predicted GIY-YIG superfamily endonuclease